MTVRELIEKLREFDEQLPVCVEVGDYGDALCPVVAVSTSDQSDYVNGADRDVPPGTVVVIQ